MNIAEMQKEIWDNKVQKGFDRNPVPLEFCHLYGEVAEAFEAWEKHLDSLGEELADVIIYALGIAEKSGIDMQEELAKKIAKNAKRMYYEDKFGVLCKVEGE